MKKSLAVRSAVAALLASHAVLAVAEEASVEGQGDLGGLSGLLYLIGGIIVMGFVIWLMTKFLGRSK